MRKTFLIVMMSVASVLMVQAQHYISLSGQLGEHSWVYDNPDANVQCSFGLGTGVGLSYELRVDHFLMSLGAAAHMSHSGFFTHQQFRQAANDQDQSGHSWTVPGVRGNFEYVYDFYKRRDLYDNLTVQVPFMMGGQWNNFYFLVGAKFETFTLWGDWRAKAEFNSYGDYSAVYGTTISHMPEHGFYDAEQVKQAPEGAYFNLNVLASAEIGYWYMPEVYTAAQRKKANKVLRVGAYVDCGVLNCMDYNAAQPLYITNTYNAAQPQKMKEMRFNSILASGGRGDLALPVEVGVKLTLMFKLPAPVPCVICEETRPKPFKHSSKQSHVVDDSKKKSKR